MEVNILGDKLVVTIAISERASKSGKTTVIASSGGNIPTTAMHKGKVVIVGLNAYIGK